MSLAKLEVTDFRNLHQVEIEPDASLNIISGTNAAGKTSLLESIFYLSYGRSFRSSQSKDLIRHQCPYFRLVTKIKQSDSNVTLGIQKSTQEQTIRLNQQSIHRVSELSSLLPVIALHPDSHQLISSGPEQRRQYIDWGVFHVEHGFLTAWKNYRKSLSQRNAALRFQQPDTMCRTWHQVLAENAQLIEQMRMGYLEKLSGVIDEISAYLFPDNQICLSYKRGWTDEMEYMDYLEQSLQRDKEKGFTQAGPHRADIKIKLDNKSAQSSISRGQQKKLVALLKLAQLALFIQTSNKTCILLYDDLPAELDVDNRKIIMDLLSTMNVQLFVSSIEATQLDYSAWSQAKMFHVEHGDVSSPNG